MTLPGISDAERMEELRDRIRQLGYEVEWLAEKAADANKLLSDKRIEQAKALRDYVNWLEAMAAGVGK